MRIKRSISMASLSVCLAATVVQLNGCSSVPKPAVADGSSRVPANDPTRIQALQAGISLDRTLLSENSLLKAQVDVLQQKLIEMTTIVRETLQLPAAPSAQPQTAPAPASPASPASAAAATAAAVPSSRAKSTQATPVPTSVPSLQPSACATNSSGVVIRVFHPFARTEFQPTEQVAQALRDGLQGAERIEVRGHTDSNFNNPIDRLIAIERAEKARLWLIGNGADAAKIKTRFFTAGNFFAENQTVQGRGLNRRVEIDIRNSQPSATQSHPPIESGASL